MEVAQCGEQRGPNLKHSTTSWTDGIDVGVRNPSGSKRPLEAGGVDDMVCGLDVCDELTETNPPSWHDNDTVGGIHRRNFCRLRETV